MRLYSTNRISTKLFFKHEDSLTSSLVAPAMRISRRMANEVGISAEQLQHLMTYSPSPKKIRLQKSLNNDQEKQLKCSSRKHEKENVDGDKRLREDLVISNKLPEDTNEDGQQFSLKNGGAVSVPRLQLKNQDQNVPLAKTKSGNTVESGDNQSLQKNKRRWKVRKTILFSYSPLHT